MREKEERNENRKRQKRMKEKEREKKGNKKGSMTRAGRKMTGKEKLGKGMKLGRHKS